MPTKPRTYRQLQAELNQILDWFESGEVEIDQALAKYQQAMALIAEMEKYIKTAENQLKKIKLKFKDQP